jgi:hypothetical protein
VRTHLIIAFCCVVVTAVFITELAGKEPDPEKELLVLMTKAKEGKLDSFSKQKLALLHRKSVEEQANAWNKLAQGLQACIDGDKAQARTSLEDTPAWVLEVANAHLPITVKQIVQKCPRITTSAPSGKPACGICGDTHEADCPVCSGTGFVLCKRCEGKGTRSYSSRCSTCGGKGYVTCSKCEGKGVIPCKCAGGDTEGNTGSDTDSSKAIFDNSDLAQVRYMLFLARRLALGATDIYSSRGAKPSLITAEQRASRLQKTNQGM